VALKGEYQHILEMESVVSKIEEQKKRLNDSHFNAKTITENFVGEVFHELEGAVEQLESRMKDKTFENSIGVGTLETVVKMDNEPGSHPTSQSAPSSNGEPNKEALSSSKLGYLQNNGSAASSKSPKVGTVSTLIDAENNQYVLVRPVDPTIHYEDFNFFHDLIYLWLCSFVFGYICDFFTLPMFFGYISAGVVLGPSGVNYIKVRFEMVNLIFWMPLLLRWYKNTIQVETLAQFGVLFILYELGLEFSFDKIRKIWRVAAIGGSLILWLIIASIVLMGYQFGVPLTEATLIGSALSLSSTAVVVKCLGEDSSESIYGRAILGILVIQDVALSFLLALLPAFVKSGLEIMTTVVVIFLKALAFIGTAIFLGHYPVHALIGRLRTSGNHELQALGCICICLISVQVVSS
jgi:hypothetical protein